jgi:DNA-binding CsgD family transcriptional regulator/tetratricopeptide (TPR) repeat protein
MRVRRGLESPYSECCRHGLLLTAVPGAGTLTVVSERGEHAYAGGGRRRIRGRDSELSVLTERIAGARAGTGGVVVAEGPPGIGKSRLLAEAVSLAAAAGLRVAQGQADEADQVAPLACLLGALHSGSPPLLSAERLLALDPRPDQRYWLLQELEALLEEAALREPLLLVIDDVQWADAATLLALRTLVPQLAPVPILWVLAVRSSAAGTDLRSTLSRVLDARAVRLSLGPLPAKAVSEVTADRLDAEADPRLLRLAEHSGGNPFLLVELLDGLREEGLVRVERGRAELLGELLPARVREGMRDRLKGISTEAREAVQLAAVLGRRFSVDRLALIGDSSPPALLGPLAELMGADVVAEVDGRLEFRHDLVREGVLASIPTSMRVALQRHAAEVLLSAGASAVEVAPLLLASASPGDAAAVTALRAAAAELAGTQPAAAADIIARALELARVDDPHRGALVAETVLQLHAAGRPSEAAALAAREFQRTLPPEQEAEVRLNLSVMFSRSPGDRTEDNRRALALDGVPAGLRAQHLARLTHNLATSGHYQEARRVAGLAEDAIRTSGERSADPALRTAVAVLEYAEERYERVIEIIDAVPPGQPRGPEDPSSDVAAAWRCEAQAILDGLDAALAETNLRLAAAERAGRSWAVHIWLAWRGRLLFQAGRLDDGRANLDAALAMSEVGGSNVANAAGLLTLGRIGLHTGDDRLVATAHQLGTERLDLRLPSMRQSLTWLRALEAAADGDPARALAYVTTGDDYGPGPGLPSLPRDITDDTELVRIALAAGDRARALNTVERAEQRAVEHPDTATMAGVAAHARGLLDGNRDALAAAVERHRSGVRPLALASALEDTGSHAATGGHRSTAVLQLGEALETYVRLGATRDAARTRRKLRDLGVRRRIGAQRRTAGWRGLTESELRVARLAARGLTNRQIGEQLFISPHTVSSHLRHTFTKLKISSRVELAKMAAQHEPAPA